MDRYKLCSGNSSVCVEMLLGDIQDDDLGSFSFLHFDDVDIVAKVHSEYWNETSGNRRNAHRTAATDSEPYMHAVQKVDTLIGLIVQSLLDTQLMQETLVQGAYGEMFERNSYT